MCTSLSKTIIIGCVKIIKWLRIVSNHRITLSQKDETEDQDEENPCVVIYWSDDSVLAQISQLGSIATLRPPIVIPPGEFSICEIRP